MLQLIRKRANSNFSYFRLITILEWKQLEYEVGSKLIQCDKTFHVTQHTVHQVDFASVRSNLSFYETR